MLELNKRYARPIRFTLRYRRALRQAAAASPTDTSPANPPGFIIGCGRSGTTILGTILEQHPSICYLLEPYHLWAAIDPRTDAMPNRGVETLADQQEHSEGSPDSPRDSGTNAIELPSRMAEVFNGLQARFGFAGRAIACPVDDPSPTDSRDRGAPVASVPTTQVSET